MKILQFHFHGKLRGERERESIAGSLSLVVENDSRGSDGVIVLGCETQFFHLLTRDWENVDP